MKRKLILGDQTIGGEPASSPESTPGLSVGGLGLGAVVHVAAPPPVSIHVTNLGLHACCGYAFDDRQYQQHLRFAHSNQPALSPLVEEHDIRDDSGQVIARRVLMRQMHPESQMVEERESVYRCLEDGGWTLETSDIRFRSLMDVVNPPPVAIQPTPSPPLTHRLKEWIFGSLCHCSKCEWSTS